MNVRTTVVLTCIIGGLTMISAGPATAGITVGESPRVTLQRVRIGNADVPPVGIEPPTLVRSTPPLYTEETRTRRIEGTVTLQALFEADGSFRVLRVVKGLGFGLDENAVAAVQSWRFLPAVRSAERISVVAEIEVPFKLPPTMGPGGFSLRVSAERLRQQLDDLTNRIKEQRLKAASIKPSFDGPKKTLDDLEEIR